ncbi:serpin (serine protease inhibitor) [Micromonospora sp. M71_S20]|uniref:serpin family protein n=1 Tax=Micromonospora sp. M71_S20 TaxID=592872 RepID=UPI000EB436EF|nr:serpin family protein [Micromonospora sp. M71_S20]RLK25721.1 serpin (serine protease inhibitor) [Micromonospora sp. M71_S20]
MSTDATNALTARWASGLDDGQTVLSGAGVYPLLALLARYAAGPARDELLAVAPEPARSDLDRSPTTRLALAAWARRDLPLTDRWSREVPAAMRGELTGDPARDGAALDEWAAAHTDGLVPRMPVRVTPTTAMVLASALSLRTGWAEPFRDAWCQPAAGPWGGRRLAGLSRLGHDLDALRAVDTAAGPLSLLTVRGAEDVDVVLALGAPGRGAAAVLPAAIGALGAPSALPVDAGPGVVEQVVDAYDDRPELLVSTVGFTVSADHDLLERAATFGLATAVGDGDHFPGIARLLAVSQARQSATATFGATGFRAGVVTAVSTRAGSARRPVTARRRRVRLDVDRPFGFLAVHRPSGLVLLAGWVTDPDAATPDAQRSPARLR